MKRFVFILFFILLTLSGCGQNDAVNSSNDSKNGESNNYSITEKIGEYWISKNEDVYIFIELKKDLVGEITFHTKDQEISTYTFQSENVNESRDRISIINELTNQNFLQDADNFFLETTGDNSLLLISGDKSDIYTASDQKQFDSWTSNLVSESASTNQKEASDDEPVTDQVEDTHPSLSLNELDGYWLSDDYGSFISFNSSNESMSSITYHSSEEEMILDFEMTGGSDAHLDLQIVASNLEPVTTPYPLTVNFHDLNNIELVNAEGSVSSYTKSNESAYTDFYNSSSPDEPPYHLEEHLLESMYLLFEDPEGNRSHLSVYENEWFLDRNGDYYYEIQVGDGQRVHTLMGSADGVLYWASLEYGEDGYPLEYIPIE